MSAPLWTVEAMAAAMQAQRNGALPADVSGLSIDTRTIQPGEAFFAIQGENRDGHDFVEAALKAGAGLAVVIEFEQAEAEDAHQFALTSSAKTAKNTKTATAPTIEPSSGRPSSLRSAGVRAGGVVAAPRSGASGGEPAVTSCPAWRSRRGCSRCPW